MPNYLITDNVTGRKVKVTGDSPPTEAEAAQIFASQARTKPQAQPKQTPADPYAGLKDFGRNSLTAIGAGLGGVGGFFTPVPGGLAAGTLLGGGVGKLAGDTIFGEQQPQAPRVNPAKGKGFGANVAEAVKNIPSSAANTVYGGLGMVGDLSRATMDQATGANPQAGMQTLTGMADMFKNLGKTDEWVMNPVGNLTTLGMVAGPTVKGAQAVGRGAGKVTKPVTTRLSPENLYASSLKMSTSNKLPVSERTARAKTGLEGGYMPTEKGYNRLLEDIDGVNRQIGDTIKSSAAEGRMIPISSIIERLDQVKERANYDINPQPILEKIAEIEKNLTNHPKAVDGQIPVDVAQKMKIETYRGLKNAYGEMKSSEVEARKAVARGLKEEIAAMVPEIGELNAKDSALINLEKSLGQATKRIANRDIVGIGGPLKVVGGALADLAGTGGIGTATGLALWALDVPQVKSALAISMYKARKAAGKATPMPIIRKEIDTLVKKAKAQPVVVKAAEQIGNIKDRPDDRRFQPPKDSGKKK